MIERGQQPRLAFEALQSIAVGGELRWEHLDGDVAVQRGVAGAVDLAHAARSERAGHLIGADSCPRAQCHAAAIIGADDRSGGTNGCRYSVRNARIGANPAARIAGTIEAMKAANPSDDAATPSATGSQ